MKSLERFGYSLKKIENRIKLFGLSPSDAQLSKQLHQSVIAPNLEQIINAFYDFLLAFPESKRFLTDEKLIARLKNTQTKYLQSLGINFDQHAYFAERLKVGLAHSRMGIPISLYISAYHMLTQLIYNAFPSSAVIESQQRDSLHTFLLKIIALDMSLALETYHHAEINHLEESLETLKEEEDQLRERANTDALTGLANHAHILSILNRELENAQKKHLPLCVVMADIDFFKKVNDTYGHLSGDNVLIEIARRLRAAVRDLDIVGRYGGEEFLIVFRNTNLITAQEIAERIRNRIEQNPLHIHELEIQITISLGLCAMKADDSVTSLLAQSDSALYKAKENGRNRVEVCSDEAARD